MILTPLQLRQAGFSDEAIIHWVNNQRPLLKEAGFSDMEINESYGLTVGKSDMLVNGELEIGEKLLEVEDKEPFLKKVKEINTKDTAAVLETEGDHLKTKTSFQSKEDLDKIKQEIEKDEIVEIEKDEYEAINKNIENRSDLVKDNNIYHIDEQKMAALIEDQKAADHIPTEEEAIQALEKGLKKHYKLKVLHTKLTTGQESNKVLGFMRSTYNWTEGEANIFNEFISFVSALESDNRNIHSEDGSAKGLFQFKDGSLVTALNRFNAIMRSLDPGYKPPRWVLDALKHKDATYLSPDQQRAITLANFYKIKRSERLNRDGTDDLIKRVARGDVEAMKELYLAYHHAEWKQTVPQLDTWELKTNKETLARTDDHFQWWNTAEVGYAHPKLATWPSWLGIPYTTKDDWLVHKMGGKGNEHVFKHGYSQSVMGMFDQYIQWNLDHPEATLKEKDDIMKEIFMYQHQTWPDEIIAAATTMLFDAPLFVAGCFGANAIAGVLTGGASAPASPVICMAGAFALPEALRHSYMEGMVDGKINSFSEYVKHFMDAKTAAVASKMAYVGAVTGTGGVVAKHLMSKTKMFKNKLKWQTAAKLSTEVYIMTELGLRINGQTPTIRDFTTTAVLIFGFHATIRQTRNLMNIYKGWGIEPKTLEEIYRQNPEFAEQLDRGEVPTLIREQQDKLLKKQEDALGIKVLPPSKFSINERVNISVDGTQQGQVVEKLVIDGESIFRIKLDNGTFQEIKADQIRKLDPEENIKVEVQQDGTLDIVPVKVKDVDIPPKGSKDDNISFKEKQTSGEYSIEIEEINRVENKIVNADGTKYKSTVTQALNDTSRGTKEKIVSDDGLVSSDGKLLVVNKYYPKFVNEFIKKNKKGEPVWTELKKGFAKTADELIAKVFEGLTNKYKKISVVFASKKSTEYGVDLLVGKIGQNFVAFSRKAYDQLITFTENGVQKTAKLMAKEDKLTSPLIFLHPETNKVIAMLMPLKFNKGDTLYKEAETYWEDFTDQDNTGTFNYKRATRSEDDMGLPNEPYETNNYANGVRADHKRFFDNAHGLRFYDLVTMVETLLGKSPQFKERLSKNAVGLFSHLKKQDRTKPLKEQATLFLKRSIQSDPALLLKVLSHELGHLMDFLPARTFARGTLLGHIAGLKKYMNQWIAGKNDGAKPLSKIERDNIKKLATEEAKRKIAEINKEIKELKITPEKILKIINDHKVRDWIDPEFYDVFARLHKDLKLSILKDAAKGMISNHIKALVNRINKVKVDPKLSDLASEIFAKRVEKEMAKRGIVDLQVIRRELKALSLKWFPWNRRTASKKEIKYRDSNNELMAEFMMAWLLRPQWTRYNAPKSFDLLKHHLQNRPEINKLYFQIQNMLNSSKDVRFAIMAEETQEMLMQGDQKVREVVKKMMAPKKGEILDDVGAEVIDSFWWMLTALKLDGQRGNSPLAKDIKYYIEHHRYRLSEIFQYQRLIDHKITKKMHKLGYNKFNLNYMALLYNLVKSKQREGKVTWKFFKMPKEYEEKFKREEGNLEEALNDYAQQHPELLNLVKEFLELRRDYVVKTIMDYEVFDQVLKDKIMDNWEYFTFRPVEELILTFKKFGAGSHAWGSKSVKATLGSFEKIISPIDATIAQDFILIGEMTKQNLYHHFVEFLIKHKKVIEETKMPDDLSFGVISKPKYIRKGVLDPTVPVGLKRISYMRHGKIHTYDIHKGTAEAVSKNPIYMGRIIRWLNVFNTPARAILTEHNWLFWAWNWTFRDMRRSLIMLPSGKKWKIPYYSAKYIYNTVFRGIFHGAMDVYGSGTKLTQHLNKNRFLIAPEQGFRTQAGMEGISFNLRKKLSLETDQDSWQLKKWLFENYEEKGKSRKVWDETAGRLLTFHGKIGRVLERSHKIGGYLTIKEQIRKGEIDMTERELMQFIQSNIGSPNFLRYGTHNALWNNLYLFFNANKEGLRADMAQFGKDPIGVGGKFIAFSVIPKVVEKMIMLGAFGYGYAQLMHRVPEYDRDNFNIWIFGETADHRPIYWRFPLDFTSQMITFFFSRGFDQAMGWHKAKSTEEKWDMWWQGVANPTPSLAPYITMVIEMMGSVMGSQVTDKFGNTIIDPLLMKQDMSWEKTMELMKYFWNTNGIFYIHKFKMIEKKQIAKEYEDMTGFSVVDQVIEKFIKVGDSAWELDKHKIDKLDKRIYNEKQWNLRKAIEKIVEGRWVDLTKEEQHALIYTDLSNNAYLLDILANQLESSGILQDMVNADLREKINIFKTIKQMEENEIDVNLYMRTGEKKGTGEKTTIKKMEESGYQSINP